MLFLAVILAWGISWYAIKLQLGAVPPESSVFWRFVTAALLLSLGLAMSGRLRRTRVINHRWFAGMGICLFSGNFVLFYTAEGYVPSGIVSVMFSASVLLNAFLAWLIEGRRPTPVVIGGALAGTLGVTFVFADQLAQVGAGAAPGIAAALGGTLLFSLGNFATRRATADGVDLLNAMLRAMGWGVAGLFLFTAIRGRLAWPAATPDYLGGLVYLAAVATIGGFIAYLRLAAAVGPERAAYANVVTPLIALLVSGVLEGYRPSLWAVAGVPLILAGVMAVFLRPASRRPGMAAK